MKIKPKSAAIRSLGLASSLCGVITLLSGSAFAMNGGQLGGYGTKNAAMGGASIALPLDSTAGINNPAGMAFISSQTNVGLVIFQGHSENNWALPNNNLTDNTHVFAPEGGGNWVLNQNMTVGLSFAGQGAGSSFGRPLVPTGLIAGAAQNEYNSIKTLDIVASVTWKVTPDLAIGIAPTLSVQQFKQEGVVVPTGLPFPAPPFGAVPSHGTQTATGWGLRVGALWKVTPDVSLGASYRSKTNMSKLGDYANDLLAYSGGKLDIPDQFGVGVAWKLSPKLTLAADWLQINWRDSKSQQDPAGQYWQNQPVLRLGASYDLNDTWTLRAGVSGNRRQIQSDNAAQNVFSPALNDRAYTAGVTMKLDSKSDISFAYELNPNQTLQGTGLSTGTTLSSKVQVFRLGYDRAF